MLAGMDEKSNTKKGARRSRADIDQILTDYRQSSLTQIAFARERGLNLGTFRSWLARCRKDPSRELCPVKIRPQASDLLTIRLPGGIELDVPGDTDPQWVISLANGLRQ